MTMLMVIARIVAEVAIKMAGEMNLFSPAV